MRYAATPRTFTPPKDVTDDVVGRAIVVTVRAIVVVGLGTPTFVAVGTLAGALLIAVDVSLEPCDGVLARRGAASWNASCLFLSVTIEEAAEAAGLASRKENKVKLLDAVAYFGA